MYCVRHEVPIKVMLDWQDYCCWAQDYNFDTPTIDEFLKGKKIVGRDMQDRLDEMKGKLEALCEEERKRLNREAKDEVYKSVYSS